MDETHYVLTLDASRTECLIIARGLDCSDLPYDVTCQKCLKAMCPSGTSTYDLTDPEKIHKVLSDTINECICGPVGDPDAIHCQSAANCIVLLELLGFDTREWQHLIAISLQIDGVDFYQQAREKFL